MKIPLEYMITELGLSFQPLQLSYKNFSAWATASWLKLVWEKCDIFDIRVDFNNVPLEFPRECDQWMMAAFIDSDFTGDELSWLNRVRVYQ